MSLQTQEAVNNPEAGQRTVERTHRGIVVSALIMGQLAIAPPGGNLFHRLRA